MRFFFYGTLIAGSENNVAGAIHEKLRPMGAASVRGRIYAVPTPFGWYPALLPGTGQVHGVLYRSLPGFGRRDLARMDAYEDCDPSKPGTSLYRRVSLDVLTETGEDHRAMTYLFNRRIPCGAGRIAGGDFSKWLVQRRARPFRG